MISYDLASNICQALFVGKTTLLHYLIAHLAGPGRYLPPRHPLRGNAVGIRLLCLRRDVGFLAQCLVCLSILLSLIARTYLSSQRQDTRVWQMIPATSYNALRALAYLY